MQHEVVQGPVEEQIAEPVVNMQKKINPMSADELSSSLVSSDTVSLEGNPYDAGKAMQIGRGD